MGMAKYRPKRPGTKTATTKKKKHEAVTFFKGVMLMLTLHGSNAAQVWETYRQEIQPSDSQLHFVTQADWKVEVNVTYKTDDDDRSTIEPAQKLLYRDVVALELLSEGKDVHTHFWGQCGPNLRGFSLKSYNDDFVTKVRNELTAKGLLPA